MAQLSSDRVYEHLRAAVLKGVHPAGTFLTEQEVAEDVGVSRTPVREALRRLSAEGFVELIPNRGAMVSGFTDRELREMLEARLAVELFAVQQACTHDRVDSRALGDVLDRQQSLVGSKQVDKFIAQDHRFHRMIVAFAGNSLILEFYDQLRDRQTRMGLARVVDNAERQKEIVTEHKRIAKRLKSLDVSGTQSAIRDHLDSALDQLRDHDLPDKLL